MPWIKEDKLYPVLVLLLIFIMAVRMPLDSDMWWHLRAGEETLVTGQVYRVDTFSSSRYGANWINHSWLSQVIMASLLRIGNLSALSVWVAVCAVICMGLVYCQMEGHPLLRSAVLVLAAMVASVVWSPRPQIMSLVLLALVSWLLHAYRDKRRWIYLAGIPLVFGVWGNLHGGYVLGLIYLGAFIGGEIFDRILLRDVTDRLSWKELGLVAVALGSGIVFVLANPFGLEIWKLPFNTIGVETLQNLINEWSSPDFHQAFQQPFLWMLLGLVIVVASQGKPLPGYRLAPVVAFAWAALVARRNFGPFAVVCAPALAGSLHSLLLSWMDQARQSLPGIQRLLQAAEENKAKFNLTARNLINLALIGLLVIAAGLKTIQVNQPELVAEAEARLFPVGAVSWIKAQGGEVKIFNEYNWGGYLIYRLPEVPVFVDGRTDLYGDEILNDYLEVVFCQDGWKEVLEKHGLEMIIIPADSCVRGLASQGGWTTLYVDEISAVMGMQDGP